MDIDEAIKLLKIHYEVAKKLEYVQNPVAFALYQVWRMSDKKWGNE